ncbi:SDR family oxidoreductase [Mycetocola sp. 2940]|uniref:SDR family NAD(P)-dependent oxidoreductase n=1 Tax=Mycetocola sp. 2940 TaxID=3156452 RepID=UPI0033911B2D
MKTAVVTGGAGEIGQALARSFADDGYSVHVVDLSPTATEVARRVGGIAHIVDLSDPDAVAELSDIPSIDVLVNGVGVWPLTSFDDLTPQLWKTYVDINLNSSYFATWACREALRAASGAVVNIASAIAFKGHAEMVFYAAAKAGVIGMTKALAFAFGPDGVRINAVAPGLISTERNEGVWSDERKAAFRDSRALPVDLAISDVVSTVRYLASSDARIITGQTLVIDGGTVMH